MESGLDEKKVLIIRVLTIERQLYTIFYHFTIDKVVVEDLIYVSLNLKTRITAKKDDSCFQVKSYRFEI